MARVSILRRTSPSSVGGGVVDGGVMGVGGGGVLGWLWLLGWTAVVLIALVEGRWWMFSMCLTVATGSWCMRLWIVRQRW